LTNEQDQKIELTPEQTNPYLARPEHFQIGAPAQTSPTPGRRIGPLGHIPRSCSAELAQHRRSAILIISHQHDGCPCAFT
jgi:hypothetical protein